MLRASATAFEYDLNVDAVRDPQLPTGVPGGNLMLRLVDSVLAGTEPLADVHDAIIAELGSEALVDAASVFGNFEMMNRVAEASGIPVSAVAIDRHSELIDAIEIRHFRKH